LREGSSIARKRIDLSVSRTLDPAFVRQILVGCVFDRVYLSGVPGEVDRRLLPLALVVSKALFDLPFQDIQGMHADRILLIRGIVQFVAIVNFHTIRLAISRPSQGQGFGCLLYPHVSIYHVELLFAGRCRS